MGCVHLQGKQDPPAKVVSLHVLTGGHANVTQKDGKLRRGKYDDTAIAVSKRRSKAGQQREGVLLKSRVAA